MIEPSRPSNESVIPIDRQVKAAMEILVPVVKKFTLTFHPEEAASCEDYSITLEVLQDTDVCGSAPFLPLRLTMESSDATDLISRCIDVIKAGYITAKGELVIDHQAGSGESVDRCIHWMHVHWFDAVDPLEQVEYAITLNL